MTKIIFIICVIFSLCAEGETAGAEDFDISIGLMSELSGPFSPNGQHCKDGYELARQTVSSGSRRIRFVYADTRGEARAGVSEFKRLVEVEGVIAVLGTRSQVIMPLNPLSKSKQVPLVTVIGHPAFVSDNPYAFRFWPNARAVGRKTAIDAIELGKRRVAILTLQDEFTLSLSEHFVAAFKESGGQVVLDEALLDTEIEFNSLISKIKKSGADAVFVNLSIPQTGVVIRKLHEQGVDAQLFGNCWMTEPSIAKTAGAEAIEGARFIDFDFADSAFLNKARELTNGSEPVAVTYACYASLAAVLQVLSEHPEVGSREELYQLLRAQEKFQLLSGELAMSEREAQLRLVARSIRDGVVQ